MLVAGGMWVQGMVGKRAQVRAHFCVTQKAGGFAATTVKLATHPPLKEDVQGTFTYK